MADIEMVDIENPHNGSGVDGFVKAQPDRRIFLSLREKYGMPPNDNPNPNGVVAAAEPQQRSRYALLCFLAFVVLFVTAAFVAIMCMCIFFLSNPTTSVGWDLFFTGLIISTIGLFVTACGCSLVGDCAEEMIDGNPEGRRTIDLYM
jgi:hypothetical protein